MSPLELIPRELRDLYEVKEWHHAATILAIDYPEEFTEVCDALLNFRFTEKQILVGGGSESTITKSFSKLLRPFQWEEVNLKAKIVYDEVEVRSDTHKIDFYKNGIALDWEWNSKDQTFDRDLYAFRTFFDFGRISLGILVTRSNELDNYFKSLNIYSKYGASTTQMNKLLPRIEAGRGGGCPLLVFGITTKLLKGS